MKNVFSLLITCMVLVSISFTQEKFDSTEMLPTPVCLDGKAVFINRLGDVVLKTNFNYRWFSYPSPIFSNGLASFFENNKLTTIDTTGKIVATSDFGNRYNFSEGLAEVEVGDKIGFIDESGKMVILPIYHKTNSFDNGMALVGIENGGDERGFVKYKWGFIDKTGNVVIGKTKNKGVGKFDDAEEFWEGLAAVKIGRKWGFINEKGQTVISFRFNEVKSFSEDLAPATLDGKNWGFIDKKGQFVIKPQFPDAEEFSEGFAAVAKDTEECRCWGFTDKSGKIVIERTIFHKPIGFSEGLTLLFFGSQGFGYADKTGKVIIKLPLRMAGSFYNGLAFVVSNDYADEKFILYGGDYIDKTGKFIWNSKEKNEKFGSNCNN